MPRYERLLHPLVRDGSTLRRASWDEALARAAAGLGAHAGTEVGLFSCSKTTNELNYAAQKLMRVALRSNNIDSCNRT
jgi:formate dehydrogenase (hydrogenase)